MNSASYEKNTSSKHSKYVVNQKLEHVEDISFRELFGRIRVVFYKIRFVSSIFNLSEACDCMFLVIHILLFKVCYLNFDFQLVGIQHCNV